MQRARTRACLTLFDFFSKMLLVGRARVKNVNFNRIKNSKPFEKHDVFVYAVLALFVAVLFVFLLFPITPSNSNGFFVTKNNRQVITYNYDSDNLVVDSAFSSLVERQENKDKIIIKIFNDSSKQHFNTLEIDKKNKTVDVIDSSCSSKECVHMAKISGSGVIYCAPHALSITCGFIPPVLG